MQQSTETTPADECSFSDSAFVPRLDTFVLVQSAPSQINLVSPPIQPSARLQPIVDRAISSVLQAFAAQNLQSDQIAVTLLDLRE